MFYLFLFVVVLAFIVFVPVSIYNSMVKHRNMVDEAWSGIEVQLKRRSDLVGNLVEVVKGYAAHEKDLLEKVTSARAAATQSSSISERAQAEGALQQALRSLFAVAENYPELKANENFLNLQNTLSELEQDIQMARRYYNGAVREYNNMIQVFPNNLFAGMFGFSKRDYFDAPEEDLEVPQVKF